MREGLEFIFFSFNFLFFILFCEEEKTEIYIQLYTGVQGLATEKMREYRKQ